jgi:hypothetical protein
MLSNLFTLFVFTSAVSAYPQQGGNNKNTPTNNSQALYSQTSANSPLSSNTDKKMKNLKNRIEKLNIATLLTLNEWMTKLIEKKGKSTSNGSPTNNNNSPVQATNNGQTKP